MDLTIFGRNIERRVNFPRFNIVLQHQICLHSYHYGVVVGILLSDGWINKQHKKGQARLFLKQSIDNSEYLFFTFFLLSHYCSSFPYVVKSRVNGKIFYGVELFTRSLFCFTDLYNNFYVNKIKCVPNDIYNILSIQALAHWICGDGTKIKGGGIILETDNFQIYDVVRLISVLIYKFNCKCTLRFQRDKPVIYISRRSIKNLSKELLIHIPESIQYKITDCVKKRLELQFI